LGLFAVQAFAGGKGGPSPGAESPRVHFLGEEIVMDLRAGPGLVRPLEVNRALGENVARLLIDRGFVGGQDRLVVGDDHSVGGGGQAGGEVNFDGFVAGPRFDVQKLALRRGLRQDDRRPKECD